MSLDLAQGIGAPSIITAYLVETHSERGRSAKHTISGYVLDAESGESLIGASIYAPNLDMGTATNQYGYFSLTVNTDSITLAFTHLGYGPVILHRHLQGDVRLNIELQAVALILDEIAIEADSDASPGDDAQMSLFKLPVAKIRSIPALVGEVDVLKILQLIPGVQAGTEATTGLYVRGGGPDQNLFLMDGVTVYNPSHLFGFLSTFNGDAIKDVKLIKGGFPARYGGRLSSVRKFASYLKVL
ncbi:MAG: TonB-dependent receptor [Bacteroidota bacterium]|nr:TonB-dependent receptor [Bacteroidota bacterium]